MGKTWWPQHIPDTCGRGGTFTAQRVDVHRQSESPDQGGLCRHSFGSALVSLRTEEWQCLLEFLMAEGVGL